jgi:hypothetical protein
VSTITALVLSAPVWREQAQSVGVIDLLVKHMQLSMEPPTITALSGAIEVRTQHSRILVNAHALCNYCLHEIVSLAVCLDATVKFAF